MTHEPPESEAWLRRLRDGESAALAELFEYFRPRLRNIVRLRMDCRLAARVDPSDVLQETYLDAASRISAYLKNPQVRTFVWLRGLTMDRLEKLGRRHLRTKRRAVPRELRLPDDRSAVLVGQLLAKGLTPSQAVLRDELQSRVQRAISRLGLEDREVILMRHFEGMSNSEVAEALGITASGATMRHGRALFRLKENLIAELPSEASPP